MSPILAARSFGASAYGWSSATTQGPAPAFDSIQTITGDGTSSIVTFSNIPQGYKDLQIRHMIRSTATNNGVGYYSLRFNSDTSSSYNYGYIIGTRTGQGGSHFATQTNIYLNYVSYSAANTAGHMGPGIIDISNYSSSTLFKSLVKFGGADRAESSGTASQTDISAGVWRSTSPVTSISLILASGNFHQTSVISLYGIKGN